MTSTETSSRPSAPRVDLSARPLTLRLYPDPILRATCAPLLRGGRQLERLANDMLTLMRARRGIGLAAPQVGLPVRLIVADVGNGPVCLIDPMITPAAPVEAREEGCLSLPEVFINVERPAQVEVHGLAPTGKSRHFAADGLLARVLQHELDHLDGILIIDRGWPATPGTRAQTPGVAADVAPAFLS